MKPANGMSKIGSPRFEEIMKRRRQMHDMSQAKPEVRADHEVLSACSVMKNNMWRGRRCFIIGGGPSLQEFDFSLLEGELVIGVNRAYEKIDPTILLGVDTKFFEWAGKGEFGVDAHKKWIDSKAIKIKLAVDEKHHDNVYEINNLGVDGFSMDIQKGLYFGGITGYAALNLAVLLGANPIYLLGFDMNPEGGNWHNGYPSGKHDLSKYIHIFDRYKKQILERTEVINLNSASNLRCFKFQSITDVVKKSAAIRNDSWIATSFYTAKTGYEMEVKKLTKSAAGAGVKLHLFECKSHGDWRLNLNHKSDCIRRAFDLFPGQDIVFIDADAIIHSYPVLFDELSRRREYDLACGFREYRQTAGQSVQGGSLLSGTLWFNNSRRSRDLVELWHKIGLQYPKIRHQHCLRLAIQQSIESGNYIWIYRLPIEYITIFDSHHNGVRPQPVIEHFQASRRLRKELGMNTDLVDSNFLSLKDMPRGVRNA